MENSTLMTKCNAAYDLMQVALNGRLWKYEIAWQTQNIRLQIHVHIFEHQCDCHLIHQNILKPNDIAMFQFFQQRYFTKIKVQIVIFHTLIQFTLVYRIADAGMPSSIVVCLISFKAKIFLVKIWRALKLAFSDVLLIFCNTFKNSIFRSTSTIHSPEYTDRIHLYFAL